MGSSQIAHPLVENYQDIVMELYREDVALVELPAQWMQVVLSSEYNFRETTGGIDLSAIVDRLEAFNGGEEAAN